MHLLPCVAIQANLELKTWPKQLLGSLPLVIVLPVQCDLSARDLKVGDLSVRDLTTAPPGI
jgi:hypothetical protein